METLETKSKKEYRCKLCDKSYSTSQNLWKHNNKFHNKISSILPQKLPQEPSKNETKYICKSCNKNLSRLDNLKRHEKNCKEKLKEKEEFELLKNLVNKMKKDNEQMSKKYLN
jgi:uncharacterized Zn-finger protein